MPVPASTFLPVLAAIAVYVTVVWVISLLLRDSGIMDVFWGPGFVVALVAAVYPFEVITPRFLLLMSIVLVWAIRLAVYIGIRNHGRGEDPRYAAWRSEAGAAWWWRSWFKVFALQGVVMWLVSFPLMAGSLSTVALGPLDWIGAAVMVAGLVFESVADWQLMAFKRHPENRGKVFDQGLWAYSRHPNYFGEAVIWVGVAVMAVGIPDGWMTLFGPILMIWLLIRVSGVRMLDDLMTRTRPEYADYIRRTSAFIPRPPRSHGG